MAQVQTTPIKTRLREVRQGGCRVVILLMAFLLSAMPGSGGAFAASAPCPEHFWQGSAPTFSTPKLAAQTQEICYTGYAVLHSGLTLTPLWSAEHLTRDRMEGARALTRVNVFHPDPNLLEDERAELPDYSGSGFDRGHLAPAGDMNTPEAMEESFSLANMVPQNPDLNRGLWERIEQATRGLAEDQGEVYVVTGPIFQGQRLRSLNGRVLVPTQIYKAVYIPSAKMAGAYFVQNRSTTGYKVISLTELQQLAGIDPFPMLPEAIKQTAGNLPAPTVEQMRERPRIKRPPSRTPRSPSTEAQNPRFNPGTDFVSGILDAIAQFGNDR